MSQCPDCGLDYHANQTCKEANMNGEETIRTMLEAERDQLRKERDQERRVRETAERESRQHAERTAELYLEREKLATEVAGLREDKARLDWLDVLDNGARPQIYLGGPWRIVSPERPAVGYWKIEDHPEMGRYETIREALDAARKQG